MLQLLTVAVLAKKTSAVFRILFHYRQKTLTGLGRSEPDGHLLELVVAELLQVLFLGLL